MRSVIDEGPLDSVQDEILTGYTVVNLNFFFRLKKVIKNAHVH